MAQHSIRLRHRLFVSRVLSSAACARRREIPRVADPRTRALFTSSLFRARIVTRVTLDFGSRRWCSEVIKALLNRDTNSGQLGTRRLAIDSRSNDRHVYTYVLSKTYNEDVRILSRKYENYLFIFINLFHTISQLGACLSRIFDATAIRTD